MQNRARKRHGLDIERRAQTLWRLAEEQQTGQIGCVATGEAKIFQDAGGFQTCLFGALPKASLEVLAKRFGVDIRHAAARDRYRIGAHQPGLLEQTLQFFTGRDPTFVGAVLYPDATLVVDIGFIQPLFDCHHHDQPVLGLKVAGQWIDRRADIL